MSESGTNINPSFFIIGAPKCGTTTMATWLDANPMVYLSHPKEPHYFNTDMRFRRVFRSNQYMNIFSRAAGDGKVTGEASTWYLFSRVAVPNILKWNPSARFIVMVRDPVDMLLSLYIHNKRYGFESADSLEQAWEMQDRRRAGLDIPGSCPDPSFLMYRDVCSLGSQIERLLFIVPIEQVCIVALDEMRNSPSAVVEAVSRFIGVEPFHDFPSSPENTAAQPRSILLMRLLTKAAKIKRMLGINRQFGLNRLNEITATKPVISAEFKERLNAVFFHEKEKLDNIIKNHVCMYYLDRGGIE